MGFTRHDLFSLLHARIGKGLRMSHFLYVLYFRRFMVAHAAGLRLQIVKTEIRLTAAYLDAWPGEAVSVLRGPQNLDSGSSRTDLGLWVPQGQRLAR